MSDSSLETLNFHSRTIHEIMTYGEGVPKRLFDRSRILQEQHEKDAFVLALIGALSFLREKGEPDHRVVGISNGPRLPNT